MTLTKEKNNTHKQRKLPNDECLFRGSNVHETDITDAKKNGIRCPYAGLCGTRVTLPLVANEWTTLHYAKSTLLHHSKFTQASMYTTRD